MFILGLTIAEIKSKIAQEWTNVYNLTFVTRVSNNEKTIIRMQYSYDSYNWRTNTDSVKTHTIWLVMKDDRVHAHEHQYKTAKMAIGLAIKEKPERIIRCQKTYDYDCQILEQSKSFNDSGGSCSIRTLANIAHITFAEARSICLKYGYNKHGMYTRKILQMYEDLGIILENKTQQVQSAAKTVKTFERQNFPGKWIIFASGHVLASINGVIVDWSSGRQLRIIKAYQVL